MYAAEVHDSAAKHYEAAMRTHDQDEVLEDGENYREAARGGTRVGARRPSFPSFFPPGLEDARANLTFSVALGRRWAPSLADLQAIEQRLCEGLLTREGGMAVLPPELAHAILLRADGLRQVRMLRRDLVRGGDLDIRYVTTDTVAADSVVAEQRLEFGRLRGVEVLCVSHDQGWATDEGSWTWGTLVVLDAADDAVVLHEEEVYRNRAADDSWQLHERVWDEGSELVQRLKSDGGRVALRLRSMYPGWVNCVLCAAITLLFA